MGAPMRLILAMLIVAGCTGAPSPPAGAARSAVEPTSTAAPTVQPAPPPTCHRLPVVNQDPTQPAGFLDVSTGSFAEDASARLTGTNAELVHTGGPTQLVGWPVGWPYFADAGRWVPALPGWVSPEGGSYLYPSYQASSIHMVDVRTADDRVVYSGRRLYPLGWTASGVYLMDWSTGAPVSVYMLSLPSGQLQAVAGKLSSVVPLHDGAAWQGEVAKEVPSRSGQNGPIANSLIRTDLATGQSERWYAEANSAVSLLSFGTDGSPLVLSASSTGERLLRVTAPDRVSESYPVTILGTAVTDSRGTWMIGTDGTVLLYRPGAAPVAVGRGPAGLKPAGACQP